MTGLSNGWSRQSWLYKRDINLLLTSTLTLTPTLNPTATSTPTCTPPAPPADGSELF